MNPLSHIDPKDPYPESDGQPMADNTEQYEWLVKIKENLEILYADRDDVFIAGDLLWYPDPDRRVTGPIAPDVMVVFGRPKGRRGSYLQWQEDEIPPQVVFEILSPSNSIREMAEKRSFYERNGVEEYYVFDPENPKLEVWLRRDDRLQSVSYLNVWTSPRMDIRFVLGQEGLRIYDPEGRPFLSSVELARRFDDQRAKAEHEAIRAEHEHRRAERLAAELRRMGIDPDSLDN